MKKIFVGCSSSDEIPDEHKKDCEAFLEKLFGNGDSLIFGACKYGLMGLAYRTALKNKCAIKGVCPEIWKDDLIGLQCTETDTTQNLQERIEKMIVPSDVAVYLPGGIGTIYELLTTIKMKKEGFLSIPIVIYNSCGFFDVFLQFLHQVCPEVESLFSIVTAPEDALKYISETSTVCTPQLNQHNIQEDENPNGALMFSEGNFDMIWKLFEVIERKRAGEITNDIVIDNQNGFYDRLIEFLDKLIKEKFASEKDAEKYTILDGNGVPVTTTNITRKLAPSCKSEN